VEPSSRTENVLANDDFPYAALSVKNGLLTALHNNIKKPFDLAVSASEQVQVINPERQD
jgi:hypothetical protein